jgi:hypothetical protein
MRNAARDELGRVECGKKEKAQGSRHNEVEGGRYKVGRNEIKI